MRLRYQIELYDLLSTDEVGFRIVATNRPGYQVTDADLLCAALENTLNQIGKAIIDIDIKE